jgi:hypothetical protein
MTSLGTEEKSGGAIWANRPPGIPPVVPPPRIPLAFLAAGAFGLLAAGAAWGWVRTWAARDPSSNPVVAAVHLGVLCGLAMAIFGATHQFVPVITSRPLRSALLAWASFASWLAGSWLLALGIGTEEPAMTAAGGAALGVGAVAVAWNLAKPLGVRGKGAPVTGLRLALAGAVLTTFLGVAFVGDRQGNWFSLVPHVDLAMGVFGLLAWLGTTYVGVAQKLWPMFMLAHPPGQAIGRVALWALWVGAATGSAGLVWGLNALSWGGLGLAAVGMAAHLISLWAHLGHRHRPADLYLAFVVTSAVFGGAATGLGLAAALLIHPHLRLGSDLAAAALASLGGWLLVALVGHAYKVVPFMLWASFRSRGISSHPSGRQLLFRDLYDHRLAAVSYLATTAGAGFLAFGLGAASSWAIASGGAGIAIGATVAAANLSGKPVVLARQYFASRRQTNESPNPAASSVPL